MKLSHICLLGVSALMFWACANRYSSPILIERGEGRNEYEREYFAVKESMGIDKRLKTSCGDLLTTKRPPKSRAFGNTTPAKANSLPASSGSTPIRLA